MDALHKGIRDNYRQAVADLIKAGTFNPSQAEVLQLSRWAADRPTWTDPAAVDLTDPLAAEILEFEIRRRVHSRLVELGLSDWLESDWLESDWLEVA